jgi:spore germination protein GerM
MVWQKYRSSYEIAVSTPSSTTEGNRHVILFFVNDSNYLARESREVESCDNVTICIKSVLEELINGPVGELDEALPEGVAIKSINVVNNQVVVDLNHTFSESILSGSSAEMLAVYSIVNTVTLNFPDIEKVKLNVECNAAIVLRHIDLSEPLFLNYSLEKPTLPGAGGS